MSRWLLIFICGALLSGNAFSQITITQADMPVKGDVLTYSVANALSALTYAADSGANVAWNYSLTATSQGSDTYKKPAEVNPLFAFSFSNLSCYGYKTADSIPGLSLLASGISISNLYTFFDKMSFPQGFAAVSFGANVGPLPVGTNYITPDMWYFFPLTYGRYDSSDFYLKFGAATVGVIKQKGYRKTRVDGWGTITTPYFTTPVSCIRVRSELFEIDSILLDTVSFGIPRTTVEYKWLVNGEHYPALWVTSFSIAGIEIPTSVRYRDKLKTTITEANPSAGTTQEIGVYPNPSTSGIINFTIPTTWTNFYIDIFGTDGRSVRQLANTRQADISTLPPGNYLARIIAEGSTTYLKIVR